ncbi:hypothetical protein QC761_0050960 [Podospora bellae-mahoneyi]|uniref:Uncharacterized protein n=1 Tax=Podospora bellae-mahoneyi TaxID=2093777 RepID=A0ABR0FJX3_9PEZI|nr:hypothetical protein QC761_0050960 [Podospora bellae-mahoneyi]
MSKFRPQSPVLLANAQTRKSGLASNVGIIPFAMTTGTKSTLMVLVLGVLTTVHTERLTRQLLNVLNVSSARGGLRKNKQNYSILMRNHVLWCEQEQQ